VAIQVEVFWVVTPCSVVVRYQRFRGPRCLYLHPEGPTTTLHGVTTQKTSTWIITTVKASNLASAGTQFESQIKYQVFWIRFFIAFLNLSRRWYGTLKYSTTATFLILT